MRRSGAPFPELWSVRTSNPGPADPLTFEWELDGDAQYDELSETPGTSPQTSSGTTSLPDEGSFALGVRVSDGEGGEVVGSFEVVVAAPPQVPALSAPAQALLAGLLAAAALLGWRRARWVRR